MTYQEVADILGVPRELVLGYGNGYAVVGVLPRPVITEEIVEEAPKPKAKRKSVKADG